MCCNRALTEVPARFLMLLFVFFLPQAREREVRGRWQHQPERHREGPPGVAGRCWGRRLPARPLLTNPPLGGEQAGLSCQRTVPWSQQDLLWTSLVLHGLCWEVRCWGKCMRAYTCVYTRIYTHTQGSCVRKGGSEKHQASWQLQNKLPAVTVRQSRCFPYGMHVCVLQWRLRFLQPVSSPDLSPQPLCSSSG